MSILFLLVCLGLLYGHTTSAYFITVDAHAEECFFDKVESGTKMGEILFIRLCLSVIVRSFIEQFFSLS